MVMAMNSEYRGSASGVAAPKKKAATRKTVATPGTKVSQATIDKIKAMGMTKALKGAANASPEMREALTRMYGARRVSAAGGSSKPAAKSADAARAAAMKPKATSGGKYVGSRFVPNTPAPKKPSVSGVVYKSADAARAAATKTAGTRIGANTVMAPGNPNRQNMPYKTPGAKPVQKDMYGNKVKSSVTIGAKKKTASTSSKSKSGYKAPTQKDMYGNKIK
jgi:hypothetical protein